MRSHGPGIAIQRCTAPTLRNLQAKAPARLREELTEDYRRMISGDTVAAIGERINEELRRRTKTQASLPSQDAVLLLLFGLLRSGQITLRTLDGHQEMKEVKKAA